MTRTRGWSWPAYQRHRAWRRRGAVVLVLVVLAGLSGADHAGWLLYRGDPASRYEQRALRVVRVVDGDTLDVALPDPDAGRPVTRVRLWGIDTPELAHDGNPAEPFARAATTLTRRLALGRDVHLTLQRHRLRGAYGRLLAYVTLPDGAILNERLLTAGLARADPRWPHRDRRRYAALAERARRAGVGLWGDGAD